MIKHFILALLSSLLLFSCNTSETKGNELRPTNTDSIQKIISEKHHKDSLDCAGLMKNSLENEGLFKAICPGYTTQLAPAGLRKITPFDTLITTTKDTLYYSFKVSAECCVNFSGMFFDPGDDTIILTYCYCGNVCDCYCDYLLTYKIPLKKYKFKRIEIEFLDMKKIHDKSGHQS